MAAETPIVIKDRFPDLMVVGKDLFPTAKPERISLNNYASSLELQERLTPAVRDSIEKARRIQEETLAIIYVAGGLTGVDEETKKRYGAVSDFLTSYGEADCPDGQRRKIFFGYVPHLHGTDPVKHPNVTPDEVRDIDHLWAVVVAHAGINFLHPLAHGNAIEEGWQEDHLIPTIYQNQQGNKLSRLVLGMNNVLDSQVYPGAFQIDGAEELKVLMDEFSTWIKTFPGRDPREFYYMSTGVLKKPVVRDVILRERGLNPDGWNPVFFNEQFLVYVCDTTHPRYGQTGIISGHDWKEAGVYLVKFSDGVVDEFYDGGGEEVGKSQISFWIK